MARFIPLEAVRVVASPAAVDQLARALPDQVTALRFAPDDLFVVGHAGLPSCTDRHAIIEPDRGFSGTWFGLAEFETAVRPHMEWQLPSDGRLGQGFIAGVPAKVHVDGRAVLVICPTAFVHELEGRIG